MDARKVSTGQLWASEETGEVFIVTSLYHDVLTSYAVLRNANLEISESKKRVKVVKSQSGETLAGFTVAERQ